MAIDLFSDLRSAIIQEGIKIKKDNEKLEKDFNKETFSEELERNNLFTEGYLSGLRNALRLLDAYGKKEKQETLAFK